MVNRTLLSGLLLLVLFCGCEGSPSSAPSGASGQGGAPTAGAAGAPAGAAGQGAAGAGQGGQAGQTAAGLALGGSGELVSIDPDGLLTLSAMLEVHNASGRELTLTASRMLFAHEGGYAFDLGNKFKTEGSFFGLETLAAGEAPHQIPLKFRWSTPITHAVIHLDASSSEGPLRGLTALPLRRSGFADPGPHPFGDQDALIGVQGPLEAIDLVDGQRWLTLVGQVINFTTKTPKITALSATLKQGDATLFSDDIKGALVPLGNTAAVKTFLVPRALPSTFDGGELTIEGVVTFGSKSVPLSRVVPVTRVEAVELAPPVTGRWFWGNGQGEDTFHTHFEYPEQRYAYDLRVVSGQSSHQGDPGKNESYFAWGKSIRAAAAGKVVVVVDSIPDNNGDTLNTDNSPLTNSFILIEHDGGFFTQYAHVRQGSAKVSVGQMVAAGDELGAVGNAGFSSEPHLHFACFRIDETGRPRALPVRFSGLTAPGGAPAVGVPRGGREYEAP